MPSLREMLFAVLSGDMLYFHTYKNPGLICDIISDIRSINDEAIKATPRKTGVIVLGGGIARVLSRGCP